MGKSRTLEEYKQEFYNKYHNSDIEILEFSDRENKKGHNNYILVKNKYGICEIDKNHLLTRGNVNIKSAINKTEYFINQAKEIHGNKYDYSLADYVPNNKQLTFTCREHGDFTQNIYDHLNGHGCSKCYFKSNGINKRYSTEEFIEKASKVHNNFYDYTESNYLDSGTKITITCPAHGKFEQTPRKHLFGRGCNKCGRFKNKNCNLENMPGWDKTSWFRCAKNSKRYDSFKVYILRCWNNEEEFYKIGRSILTIKQRYSSKLTLPYNYEILQLFEFKELTEENARKCYDLEVELKNKHKEYNITPVNTFKGSHECFSKIII